jgi:hypothetical protein
MGLGCWLGFVWKMWGVCWSEVVPVPSDPSNPLWVCTPPSQVLLSEVAATLHYPPGSPATSLPPGSHFLTLYIERHVSPSKVLGYAGLWETYFSLCLLPPVPSCRALFGAVRLRTLSCRPPPVPGLPGM